MSPDSYSCLLLLHFIRERLNASCQSAEERWCGRRRFGICNRRGIAVARVLRRDCPTFVRQLLRRLTGFESGFGPRRPVLTKFLERLKLGPCGGRIAVTVDERIDILDAGVSLL